jgi:enoyl-CoA hydratase/carnithine racemase
VELAMNCDLRLASPDLRMSVPAVSLGVVYRYEFVSRLIAICGLHRTNDLLLGMQELDAAAAHAWGLLTEIVDVGLIASRAQSLAQRLALSPRSAVRGTKASLNLRIARAVAPEDAARANEIRAAAASSPERREALRSRRKK